MLNAAFGPRSRSRDLLSDSDRHHQLLSFLDGMIEEVESELAGLQKRQTATGIDTSMFLQAEESGQLESGPRLKELETALLYCEQRLAKLANQVDALRRLRQEAAQVFASSSSS